MDFLPDFGSIPLTIVAFVTALSVIVAVHEYGHYIVGRWSGIKADVFSVGFGPILFKRTDKHGTQWQIAALPFGGYVKFRGDSNAASAGADESVMSVMTDRERRETMHGAPLWARAATVAAGPIFNFILSFFIFAGFLLFEGQAADEARIGPVIDAPDSITLLAENDLILAVDGEPVNTLRDALLAVEGPTAVYTVERDGQVIDVEASAPMVPVIGSVAPQSAALAAGLREGDFILSVNDVEVDAFSELRPMVDAGQGAPMALRIWREGEELDITLEPRRTATPLDDGGFENRYLIGIGGGLFFEPFTEPVGLWQAAQYGVDRILFIMEGSLSGLYHIAVGAIDSCNLQGPIGIAETSGAAASQGVDNFIWFIAVLSTAVGLLNLFPIPVLDGGHLVFHAYEAVIGRPPSDKAMRVFMSVGLTLILALMLFALSNDLFC